jgi:transcriptional regulator
MYVPKHFSEDDVERLATLIGENGFGAMVTISEGRPFASHIPFIYDRGRNALLGHVARANPQWRHFSGGAEVMVLFQGPHAYISPSWYLSPGVPTWNYAVAHVYGRAQALEDPSRIRAIVEALTDKHEHDNKPPWAATYDPRMLNAIVGIEVAINEIQGKFKLSQNRSAADRTAVIAKLQASGAGADLALAKLMAEKSSR